MGMITFMGTAECAPNGALIGATIGTMLGLGCGTHPGHLHGRCWGLHLDKVHLMLLPGLVRFYDVFGSLTIHGEANLGTATEIFLGALHPLTRLIFGRRK